MPGPSYPFATLAGARPELRYAYRGPVPYQGSHRHSPAWYSCWLVEQGWAEVRLDGQHQVRADEGEWLLCPPFIPRYQIFPAQAAILSIAFNPHLPPEAIEDRNLPMVISEPDLVERLRSPGLALIRHLHGSADHDVHRRTMEALDIDAWFSALQALCGFALAWHEALATPSDTRQALDARVVAARQVLAADPRMGPVPYERLRERTGLSPVHLDRLFREHLGHSPKAELDRLCLERVLRRLADPRRPLKAVALELGFTDSSHLCRWFRKRSGQSPERYRAMPLT